MKDVLDTNVILENVTAAKDKIDSLECDELDKSILQDCMSQIWDSTLAIIELNSENKPD